MSSGGPQHSVVAGGPSWVLVLNLLKPLKVALYNKNDEPTRGPVRSRGDARDPGARAAAFAR